MAQVITGGPDVFDALVYGAQMHPETQSYLAAQVSRPSELLTEAGRSFMAGAKAIYESITSSTAARIARAAGRRARSIWQTDEIRELASIAEIQNAPLTMQRWIMAEPNVRKLYHRQQCDGYSDTYVDMHPKDIGVDHYDYRRVMNGVVTLNEDEDAEYEWSATTYLDELLPEDRELLFEEQVDIIATWGQVVAALRAKKSDPTSKWDDSL